jgi:hypothetical protein
MGRGFEFVRYICKVVLDVVSLAEEIDSIKIADTLGLDERRDGTARRYFKWVN